ncbi:unnamed protein product [Ambrosiozyma monospora]|uniref:Unnamed protein product n=1 Tax=Ambrosiozyma monospora TaxID=43982 RepID=A0ACB5TD89_AMBMO|nr:unnamed protein product [Ambrosiozyma monospora]
MILFQGLMFVANFHLGTFVGSEAKGILTKVLVDKSFKLSRQAKLKYSPSDITSLLGNDLSKIDMAAPYATIVIGLPISLIMTICLVGSYLGGAAISGIVFLIVATVFVSSSAKRLIGLRIRANISTDLRVKYVKEIISSIKIIKFYAWEPAYTKLVVDVRKQETNIFLKIQILRNVLNAIYQTLPSVSALVGFLSMFGQFGGLKSAASIFSSLTLYNILATSISALPFSLSSSIDAWIAFKRIQEYLLADEENPDPNYHVNEFNPKDDAINIRNADFTWNIDGGNAIDGTISLPIERKEAAKSKEVTKNLNDSGEESINAFPGLKNINLTVQHGEFVIITGLIGSGKSSLLAALDGSMSRTKGTVDISGEALLCSVPWIQNASVRDNIYFGQDSDPQLYKTVVDVCALQNDFDILPAGDLTEIGERGVNLSGGQKVRINLARAVYRVLSSPEYNIILLDDVLSAVDAKVGKHILEKCLLGVLKSKTVVLATHQLSLIRSAADKIIFLNGDGTLSVGTQTELIEKNAGLANLMVYQQEKANEQTKEKALEEIEDEEDSEERNLMRKLTTIESADKQDRGKLIHAEKRETNSIDKHVYYEYLKAGYSKVDQMDFTLGCT